MGYGLWERKQSDKHDSTVYKRLHQRRDVAVPASLLLAPDKLLVLLAWILASFPDAEDATSATDTENAPHAADTQDTSCATNAKDAASAADAEKTARAQQAQYTHEATDTVEAGVRSGGARSF